MNEQPGQDWLGFLAAVVTGVASLLVIYPDLLDDAIYQARLWLAYREGVNYGKLRWQREHAKATGETADRVIVS